MLNGVNGLRIEVLYSISCVVAVLFMFACGQSAAAPPGPAGDGGTHPPASSAGDLAKSDAVSRKSDAGSGNVDKSITAVPVVKGMFINKDRTTPSFDLEVARTDAQREHGLMFRQSMEAGRGMLFVFDRDAPRSFWMKNTYIPLDMIFATSDGIVVGIVENAAPLTLDERRCDVPARFVIELNAFQAARHGIKVGSLVVFDPVLDRLPPVRK